MNDIRKLIESVLEKGHLMSLATVDQHGPWVSDVIYVHDDDLTIYWLSRPEVRHSKAIGSNGIVAASITLTHGEDDHDIGIQLHGIASYITDDIAHIVQKYYIKRGKPPPAESEGSKKGYVWFMLKPKTIDLIYEPLFGYTKKALTL